MSDALGAEHGVVLPVRVDPTGRIGPRKREAAGPEWRRTSRGMYVPAYVEETPQQRIVEMGILLPPRAAVTGWAALAWSGAWWFGGTRTDGVSALPVPICCAFGRRIRPQRGLWLCEERCDSSRQWPVLDGLRITQHVRSVCFEMRYAPDLVSAARALSMAAFHDLVTVDEAAHWAATHPSYTGIEQCRQALGISGENFWSPREVDMAFEWESAGCGRPLANRPVFDLNGRHIGTPDLIDPVTGVVGEYDGALHLEGSRRALDLRREHAFREHRLEPVTMVAADVRQPSAFRARLRAAYARVEPRPGAERAWTLERPPWWPATFTVTQRRALSSADQKRWLKHRQAG